MDARIPEWIAHASLLGAATLGWSFGPSGAREAGAIAGGAVACAGIAAAICSKRSQYFVPTVFAGPPHVPSVALTFDDGPDPRYTPDILAILAAHNVRASFFLIGERVLAAPSLARRILDEGHNLGGHTHRHAHGFHFWRGPRQSEDIRAGLSAITVSTGHRPRYFRPPQGLRVPALRVALEMIPDVVCVTWTTRGGDAMGASCAAICSRVEAGLTPGAIITLHDGADFGGTRDRRPTIEALPRILRAIEARGLHAVTLDELLVNHGQPRKAG